MSRQYPLPLPHSEAMAADDFMITASNREAAAWLDRWPNWPAHCLVVHGPSGSGKTHLAQVWKNRSKAIALAHGELPERDAANIFLIDDADKISGVPAQEEALFHLYNRLLETKGSLLLTSTHAPAQWGIQLPDLRSRLSSVPTVGITAPDDELISALLIKQFMDRQIDVSTEVVDYLLPRVERSPAVIRKLVGALDHASMAEGRRITVALARNLLENQDFLI